MIALNNIKFEQQVVQRPSSISINRLTGFLVSALFFLFGVFSSTGAQAFAALSATTTPTAPVVTIKGPGTASKVVVVKPSGGKAPYTYTWTQTDGTVSKVSSSTMKAPTFSAVLTSGQSITETWTVQIKDAKAATVTLTVPMTFTSMVPLTANLVPTAISKTISGAGTATAQASLNVSGGKAPYVYSWTRASGAAIAISSATSATPTFSFSLQASQSVSSSWSVKVTDSAGSSKSLTIPVGFTSTPNLVATVSPTKLAKQIYGSGSVTASASISVNGGQAPYSYSWTRGTGSITSIDAANTSLPNFGAMLSAGQQVNETWTAIVSDSLGGSVSLNLPLEFKSLVPLSATVTPSSVSAQITGAGVASSGASVTASGGVAPYSYLWTRTSGSVSTISSFSSTSPIFSAALSAGQNIAESWSVEVKDAAGMSVSLNVPVNLSSLLPLTVNVNKSLIDVEVSGAGTATADVSVSIQGGVKPYSLKWHRINGDVSTISGDTSSSPQISAVLTPGQTISEDWRIEVVDASQTTLSKNLPVRFSSLYAFFSDGPPCLCKTISGGGHVEFAITALVQGGSAPYTFTWVKNSGDAIEISNPNSDFTVFSYDLKAGQKAVSTWSVTVTDAQGTSFTRTIPVEFTATSPLEVSLSPTSLVQKAIGVTEFSADAQVNVIGGYPPYQFAWSQPLGSSAQISSTTSSTPTFAATLSEGQSLNESWTLRVSDQLGGAKNIELPIHFTSISPIKLTIAPLTRTLYGSGSIMVITLPKIEGGVEPYSYSWTRVNGSVGTEISDVTARNPSISAAIIENQRIEGSWLLTVTDSEGQTISKELSYDFFGGERLRVSTSPSNPVKIIEFSSVPESERVNGKVKASVQVDSVVTGGLPPYSYVWSHAWSPTNEKLISSDSLNAASVNLGASLSAGQHIREMWKVSVTDANSSMTEAVVDINLSATVPQLKVSITPDNLVEKVYGAGTPRIKANAEAIGGTPPYSYKWQDKSNTAGLLIEDDTNVSIYALAHLVEGQTVTGTLSVAVTDSQGQVAVADAPIELTSIRTLSLDFKPLIAKRVGPGSVFAKSELSVTNGVAPYSYLWTRLDSSRGTEISSSTDLNPTFSAELTDGQNLEGFWQVTVTDTEGHWAKEQVPFQFKSTATLDVSVTPKKLEASINGAGEASASVNVNVRGGVASYSYEWKRKNGTLSTVSDSTAQMPTISAILTEGQIISEVWTVTVTDADGVAVTAELPIEFSAQAPNPALAVTLSTADLNKTLVGAGTVSAPISASVVGGVAPYSFTWTRTSGAESTVSSGDSASTIISATLQSGHKISETWSLRVTDSLGASVDREVRVSFESLAPLDFTLSSAIVTAKITGDGIASGSVDVTTSGGTQPYSYQWTRVSGSLTSISNAASSNVTFSANLLAGQSVDESWMIRVTDALGVSTQKNVSISLISTVAPIIVKTTPAELIAKVHGAGVAVAAPALEVSGGQVPYTYRWSRDSGTVSVVSNALEKQPIISASLSTGQTMNEVWKVEVTDAKGQVASILVPVQFTSISPLSIALSPESSIIAVKAANGGVGSIVGQVVATGGVAPYAYVWTRTSGSRSTISNNSLDKPTISASLNLGESINETWTVTVTDAENKSTQKSLRLSFIYFSDFSCEYTAIKGGHLSGNYTGSVTGPVWGGASGIYSADSDIATAAVHAGLLSRGSTGAIVVTPLEWQVLRGSTANGITTKDYPYPDYRFCGMKLSRGSDDVSSLSLVVEPGSVVQNASNDSRVIATAKANVSGGVPPYSYLWKRNGGFGVNIDVVNQNTDTPTFVTVMEYEKMTTIPFLVTVTDSVGDSVSSTVQVTLTTYANQALQFVNPNSSVTALRDGPGAISASIDISAHGGGGSYTYAATSQGGRVSAVIDTSAGAPLLKLSTSIADGENYVEKINVSATDNRGTQVNQVVTASFRSNGLRISTDANVIDSREGSGELATGRGFTVAGGTAPYTYNFTRITGSKITASVTGANIANYKATLQAGETISEQFDLVVTDSTSKTATSRVNVAMSASVLSLPLTAHVDPAVINARIAQAGLASMTANVIAENGKAPYTYVWNRKSGSSISINGSALKNPTFSASLSAGQSLSETWNVVVTDAAGASVSVDLPITFSVTPTSLSLSMNQGSASAVISGDGVAEVYVSSVTSGGVAPYTYRWERATGTVSQTSNSVGSSTYLFARLTTGQSVTENWKLTVTDAIGSSAEATLPVSFRSLAILSASVNPSEVSAKVNGAGYASASASVSVTGGLAPYSYMWRRTTGSVGTISDFSSPNPSFLAYLAAGQSVDEIWSVDVTDSRGTVKTLSLPVKFVSATLIIVHKDIVATDGSPGALAYAEEIKVSGGVAPYTYSLKRIVGSRIEPSLVYGPNWVIARYDLVINPNETISEQFEITVTDSNGLIGKKIVNLSTTVGDAVLEFTGAVTPPTLTINRNGAGLVSGSVTAQVFGGVAPYHFNWIKPVGARMSSYETASASSSKMDFSLVLANNETVTEQYYVGMTDSRGGFTSQVVNVTFSAKEITPPPDKKGVLQLSSCMDSGIGISPFGITKTCDLKNIGDGDVTGITYSSIAGINISGPTGTCAAGSSCGTVTISSGTAANTYSGKLTVTPSPTLAVGTSLDVAFTVAPSCAAQTPANGTYIVYPSGQPVWGDNINGYKVDSNLGMALVHSGLAKQNETVNVVVTPMNILPSFKGSFANVINSYDYAKPACGMKLSLASTPIPKPSIQITRTPSPLVAGQSFVTSWTSTGATSVSYSCTGGISATLAPSGTADPSIAPEAWINSPLTCTWNAVGPGGNADPFTETLITIATANNAVPSVTLKASNTNVRVASGSQATVTVDGTSSITSGLVSKLELIQSNGSSSTVVKSETGSSASLSMNSSISLAPGIYSFTLKAYGNNGTTKTSSPVVVNVTDSSLLGEISGIRSTASGGLELLGWTCEDTNVQALSYTIYANAPSKLGGTQIGTGTANVATEITNSKVQANCHTLGSAHHFKYDLTSIATTYGGSHLFVEASVPSTTKVITLPCADYNCTLPDAMRIGITTPADAARYTGPATVFMQAKLQNLADTPDEVAFNLDGEWIQGQLDSTGPGLWKASKANLASRATPYSVYAKLRKGDVSIYTPENLIYVDAVNLQTDVTMVTPANGAGAVVGTAINLQATAIPKQGSSAVVSSVRFYSGSNVIASVAALGGIANAQWSPTTAGQIAISAEAFDSNGLSLGKSNPSMINVAENQTASDPTPIPVDININQFLALPDAGSLPGSLAVTPSGAATYSIPIEVPPGTAGMQPKLTLAYNSQSGNGMLGLGWNLSGLSAIHRCPMTIAQDGFAGRISFDGNDRLCLDGQRLVLVNLPASNANYWSSSAVFRTEQESFSRISRLANGGFKVESRDGRVDFYGTDASSALVAQGRVDGQVMSWTIARSEDRYSNYQLYDYLTDSTTGESLPKQIRYGGNTNASQVADIAVKFVFEERGDAQVMYVGGSRSDMRRRLQEVQTYIETDALGNDGKFVRGYRLMYTEASVSGRSMVESIQVRATSPITNAIEYLPKTAFSVDLGQTSTFTALDSTPFALPSFNPPDQGYREPLQLQTQLDGSGHTNFVAVKLLGCGKTGEPGCNAPIWKAYGPSGELKVRLANGDEASSTVNFAPSGTKLGSSLFSIGTGFGVTSLQFADINADGREDMIVMGDSEYGVQWWSACLNESASASNLSFNCNLGEWKGIPTVVDLRGDHKMHLLTKANVNGVVDKDCYFINESRSISCNPIQMRGLPPELPVVSENQGFFLSNQDFFNPIGVKFSKSGMSDFYSVWRVYVPAANANNAYDNQVWFDPVTGQGTSVAADAIQGVSVCTNKPDGISCQVIHYSKSVGKSMSKLTFVGGSGDLNGDGLTDFVFEVGKPDPLIGLDGTCKRDCSYPSGGFDGNDGVYVCLSTETGINCTRETKKYYTKSNGNDSIVNGMIGDFIGDGVDRILLNHLPNAPEVTDAKSALCRYSINGFICQDLPYFGKDIKNTEQAKRSNDLLEKQPVWLDDSGVAAYLLKSADKVSGAEVFTRMSLVGSPSQDKMIRASNGVGVSEEVSYARGDDTSVYHAIAKIDGTERKPVYPKIRMTPDVLVKELRRPNGVGGWLTAQHYYEGSWLDVTGRGALGFGKFQQTDASTGVTISAVLSQDYPHIGEVLSSQSQASNGTILSTQQNAYTQQTISHANGAQTILPLLERTTTSRWDLNGAALSTTTIQYDYTDGYGNPTKVIETNTGGGKSFTSQITTDFNNSTDTWLLGLPKTVQITKTDSETGSITRNTEYRYLPTGLLEKQITEPGTTLQVVLKHERDAKFGLVEKSVQSWTSPTNMAMARNVLDVTYDTKGRFIESSKNAMGHSTSYTSYPGTGSKRTVTDPNLLKTTVEVDGFGRTKSTLFANQNQTRSYQKQCVGNCPLGAIWVEITESYHGAEQIARPSVIFKDALGHVVRSLDWSIEGKLIHQDQRYDEQGRLFEVLQPYFAGETAYLSARLGYDTLGRVISSTQLDERGQAYSATKTYNGLELTLTNVLGKITLETRDAVGHLINIRDSGDGKGSPPGNTSMTYDAFGNLLTTKNPNGNIVRISYDRLGRKTDLNDPDLGWIHYDLDAAGRVWQQIGPEQRKKGESSRFEHDALDRMTGRFEPDLKSYWNYDTAANGIGALAESYTGQPNAKDYRREHQYDSQGRLTLTRQSLYDGSYDSIPHYDNWGRIVRQTYQRNGAAKSYDFRYNDKGHLTRIERGALKLWELKAQDAAKRSRQAQLGNGLGQIYDYDPYTARLRNEELRRDGALKLAESYQYNVAGQLSSRAHTFDSNQYAETFDYDDLNRLTGSTVAGQNKKINRYDPAGNLLNKTGTGTGDYDYGPQGANAIRPHAVKSIPSLGNFTYDDNGNLTTGAGRSITWSSFDMPKRIAKADGVSSDFVYGTEHQRTRQDRSDGSRLIYAGSQEVEINAQGTTVKTYWPANLGLEIDKPNGSTELRWIHTDHLGSPTAISDASGNLVERLSYDAWGKRRTNDGSATPDNLDGQVDNKGFTGHEMLDQLDLVHMNGRVYDPLTARFMSADPHVTDPTNGQNYNRYSYVLNDPLGMTDPTGWDNGCVPNNYNCGGQTGSKDGWVTYGGFSSGSVTFGRMYDMQNGMNYGRRASARAASMRPEARAALRSAALGALSRSAARGTTVAVSGGGGVNPVADGAAILLFLGLLVNELNNLTVASDSGAGEDGATASLSTGTNSATGSPPPNNEDDKEKENNNEAKDGKKLKKLSDGEVKKLKDAGENPHDIKGKSASRYDLYKDRNGNVYQMLKGGRGEAQSTGINLTKL